MLFMGKKEKYPDPSVIPHFTAIYVLLIHITETALENYNNFDYIVFNDNYDKLINQIEAVLRSVDYE